MRAILRPAAAVRPTPTLRAMTKILIPDVQRVSWTLSKSLPPRLNITAGGEVPTGGWSAPELANPRLRPDGILVLDFLIAPPAPGSMVTQAFQQHEATIAYADPAAVLKVRRIRVLGANGDWAEVPLAAEAESAPTAAPAATLTWPPEIPPPWPLPFPLPRPRPFPLPHPLPPIVPPIKPPVSPVLIAGLQGYLIRVLRPGDVVTADFRSDRVNFHLDAQGRIERHSFY